MHSQIPEPLRALVEQLARLPGLGPKSAMRVAMTLLKWPEAEVRRLGKGVYELRDTLHLCSRCGGLSDSDPCPICADKERDESQLCLVAEGTADAYPRFGPTMEWNTAAGHAVVRAAGREVWQAGRELPLRYNKEDLLNPYFIAR